MRTADVISFYGSEKQVTDVLSLSRSYIYQWGEFVPEEIAMRLHFKTEGELKYDAHFYATNPNTSKYPPKNKNKPKKKANTLTSSANEQSAA